jgi:hypothetical protein
VEGWVIEKASGRRGTRMSSTEEAVEERREEVGMIVASRVWDCFEAEEEEKVCIRGRVRLVIDGWGVGRWVVVMVRDYDQMLVFVA